MFLSQFPKRLLQTKVTFLLGEQAQLSPTPWFQADEFDPYLDYPQVVTGFLVVALLALVIDLLLGSLQLLLPRPSRRPGRGSTRLANHATPLPLNASNRAASGYAKGEPS